MRTGDNENRRIRERIMDINRSKRRNRICINENENYNYLKPMTAL